MPHSRPPRCLNEQSLSSVVARGCKKKAPSNKFIILVGFFNGMRIKNRIYTFSQPPPSPGTRLPIFPSLHRRLEIITFPFSSRLKRKICFRLFISISLYFLTYLSKTESEQQRQKKKRTEAGNRMKMFMPRLAEKSYGEENVRAASGPKRRKHPNIIPNLIVCLLFISNFLLQDFFATILCFGREEQNFAAFSRHDYSVGGNCKVELALFFSYVNLRAPT